MVKITNIKVQKIDFSKEKSDDFKKCLKLVPDLLDILPKAIKYNISFELENTNSDFANAIRRIILNESPVKSLDYNEYKDVETTDPYILSDLLKKQVDLLPINQDMDYSDISLSLDIKNDTDYIIDVKAGDFVALKANKKINIDRIISPLIVISKLRPGETLAIKNIKIKEGIGREDAGAFSNVSNIYFKPLDIEPLNIDKNIGKSSLVSNPTRFKLGYGCHRNTDSPLSILKRACDTLRKRLETIIVDFKNIKDGDEYYYSDLLQVETKKNVKEVHFKNESWTIANIIARYCYTLTDGHIKFVSPSIVHPEKDTAIIKIAHPEYNKIIIKAMLSIQDDLKIVEKGATE
jgi:DNA-directed RNA polymerase subunit L